MDGKSGLFRNRVGVSSSLVLLEMTLFAQWAIWLYSMKAMYAAFY